MKLQKKENTVFPLKTKNVGIIAAGILIIIIGNILLAGEDFIDAKNFSLALYVVPFFMITGVIAIILGILYSFKRDTTEKI